MKAKSLNKSKIISLILIIIMLLNMFSPYGSLFTSEVKAAIDGIPNPSVVFRRSTDILEKNGIKYFETELAIVGDVTAVGFDLKLSYDSTKIEPANKSTKKSATTLKQAIKEQSAYLTSYQLNSSYLDVGNSTFRLSPVTATPENPFQDGYTEEEGYDTYEYNSYMLMYTMTFRLVDETLGIDDLTTDLFQLTPATPSLPTGFEFGFVNENNIKIYKNDVDLFGFGNFVEGDNAKVKNATLQKLPEKINYIQGEKIDLTGGELLVELKDGTTQTVSMKNPNVNLMSSDIVDKNKQEVKISYYGKPVTFTIYVSDPTESIILTRQPTKMSYNYNEIISLDGAEIKAIAKSGAESTIVLPDASVSIIRNTKADLSDTNESTILGTGIDGNPAGVQTVTIEYDGRQLQYSVVVNQSIQNIQIENQPKTNYNYGESLSLEGGILSVETDNGKTEIPLTDSSVKVTELDGSEFNSKILGTRNLKVEYMGREVQYSVTINDYIERLQINNNGKVKYNAGESLNLNNIQVLVITASGKVQESKNVTEDMLTTNFDSSIIGPQTIKLLYAGLEGKFNITVYDAPDTIEVIVPSNITSIVGEDLDLSQIKLNVYMVSGSVISGIPVTNSMLSGYDKTTLGNQTVTVTYEGKTDTLDVEVIEKVLSISMKTNPVEEVKHGNDIDLKNAQITVVKTSGTEDIAITKDMLSGFDKTTLGEQTVTVTHGGQTTTFEVTVVDYVKDIELIPPTKTTYLKGEELDLTGASVKKVMASGAATTAEAITENMIAPVFDKTILGRQNLTVTYGGISKTFDVIVKNDVTSITVDETNGKLVYKYGEKLDVNNITLTVNYENGDIDTNFKVTESMVTGFNSNLVTNSQELTVTLGGKTDKYYIEIKDYVKDIEVKQPTKTVYKINDKNNLDGGKIIEKMASKVNGQEVLLTDSKVNIKGFETNSIGTKTITVEYTVNGEKLTGTYQILVVDELKEVNMTSLPTKLVYKYGENLDLTGAKLEVKTESGATKIINVDSSMISGYNKNNVGKQTLTVTYEGQKQTFTVEVADYVKGITITKPTKLTYEYDENLNLTGGTVAELMASGKTVNKTVMTASMISGFDSKKSGKQTITVDYNGFKAQFDVKINNKQKEPENNPTTTVKPDKPSTPTKPVKPVTPTKPSTPSKPKKPTQHSAVITTENNVGQQSEEIKPEENNKYENNSIQENNIEENNINENKINSTENVITDLKYNEKTEEIEQSAAKATIVILIAMLILLAIAMRKNVKIYVQEDGEYVFGGFAKITKDKAQINIDKYLDEETINHPVKIVINDGIYYKLKEKEIEIIKGNKTRKYKIKEKDGKYQIVTKI